jgi:phosphoglycerol transferase MdoB-like AlkP superfamily enzyme
MHPEPRPPLIKRLRPGHWLALDYLAAATYALFALAMLTHHQSAARLPLALTGAALVTLPIAFRRRYPLAAYGVLLAGLLATPMTETLGMLAIPLWPTCSTWLRSPAACVPRWPRSPSPWSCCRR